MTENVENCNGKKHACTLCSCTCRGCCERAENQPRNGTIGAKLSRSLTYKYEIKNTQQFSDDGTNTYFWRAHSITVLIAMICVLTYVALFEEVINDSLYNTKRGVFACVIVFVLFGATHVRDGPFNRPHPVIWRMVLCFSILYELVLIFVLFQTAHDARQFISHFDKNLGKELPEKNYASNCLIYDHNNTENPWHNLMDKFDEFVPAHFFGWWIKALILRDYWLLTVASVGFEVMEYTLEHQLPNFHECWWDHWIVDFLLCNGLGIYAGMKTCEYLAIKPYHWHGLWNIPSYSGKLKRAAAQFTPYNWKRYNWKATASLHRWILTVVVMVMWQLAELNCFYLKFVLWVPPPHYLNALRLGLFSLMGGVSVAETYKYMEDKNCKRFGQQAWIVAAIIITELLVCIKFGWETVTIPLPPLVKWSWITFIAGLFAWTIWKFWPSIIHGFYWDSHEEVQHDKTE